MVSDRISLCEFVKADLYTRNNRGVSGEEGKLASHVSSSYFFPSFLPLYFCCFTPLFVELRGKTNHHEEDS